MPSGYSPLYFASDVLPNGQVIVNGGEYNGTGSGVWTTKGALYDPPSNSWVSVAPPSGWTTIGDAQSVVLPNGTYVLANCCNTDAASLDLATMTWTPTGTGKADSNDEEGWTLLPSGQVLTVDTENSANPNNSEILTNGAWASAGTVPVDLVDHASAEIGPQVLRPDGTVVAIGATGFNAIYNTATGTWAAGPRLKGKLDEADGPGVLLPTGNILLAASPGVYKSKVKFFEFTTANTLVKEPGTPNAAGDSSFSIRLLPLPNGQVLEVDGSREVEIYTPSGAANASLAPSITSFPATVTHGQTYTLTGVYLNGYSQAVGYGDDYQAATNYPLARITNEATGHVFYARTANHSSMAVASPLAVTTQVSIPAGIETGASTIVVVANGIPSAPLLITVN